MSLNNARELIQTTCKQKGWSVMELARKSEVSPEAIRRFVAGRGEVSTRVVFQLLKALNIDPNRVRR